MSLCSQSPPSNRATLICFLSLLISFVFSRTSCKWIHYIYSFLSAFFALSVMSLRFTHVVGGCQKSLSSLSQSVFHQKAVPQFVYPQPFQCPRRQTSRRSPLLGEGELPPLSIPWGPPLARPPHGLWLHSREILPCVILPGFLCRECGGIYLSLGISSVHVWQKSCFKFLIVKGSVASLGIPFSQKSRMLLTFLLSVSCGAKVFSKTYTFSLIYFAFSLTHSSLSIHSASGGGHSGLCVL